MDDGEIDFSNQEVLRNSIMGEIGCDCSMDSLFDELMMDKHVCTHMHTCNPPGPDNAHTHTCVHVHTKIVPASTTDMTTTTTTEDSSESVDKKGMKRTNREAVRKYREKKKARYSLLEEEVVRLRAVNQQLVKRLQGRAALEAEVARLKCLLVDVRGRIDGEIGCFPYQKAVANSNGNGGGYVMNHCNGRCDGEFHCQYGGNVKHNVGNGLEVLSITGCEFDNHHCPSVPTMDTLDYDAGNGVTSINSSRPNKRKGGGVANVA